MRLPAAPKADPGFRLQQDPRNKKDSAMSDYVIGIEIGGTKLQAVLGTATGEICTRERGGVDVAKGAAGILDWIEGAVEKTISGVPEGARATGIGVGFGGPVESSTGRVLTSHQIEGWDGVLLKEWLESKFSRPVVIENDANTAGWAEYCLGAGQGTRNFVYCNIGSGIGGALIADGALYNGQGYGACEIGHTYVPDWTSETSGASNKLENLCSGWSITRRIQRWSEIERHSPLGELCDGNPKNLTCPILAEAARRGDQRALAEVIAIARGVGTALSNVVTLLHPERIALGGGVSLMGDVLLDHVQEHIANHVFGPYEGRYDLVPCALEEDVVTVGTLLLAGELCE
jgi:glucokinase